jgi:hypothetical protein
VAKAAQVLKVLKVLKALRDVLECGMEDLIEPVSVAGPGRKERTASGEEASAAELRLC